MHSQVATGSLPDCLVPDHSAVSGSCHKREPASWNKGFSKPPGLHWAGTLEMLGEPIGTAPGPVLQFPSHLLSQPRCPPVWVTTVDLLSCSVIISFICSIFHPPSTNIRSSPPQQGGKVQRLGARLRSGPLLCYLLVKGSLTGHITALSLLTGVRWY